MTLVDQLAQCKMEKNRLEIRLDKALAALATYKKIVADLEKKLAKAKVKSKLSR